MLKNVEIWFLPVGMFFFLLVFLVFFVCPFVFGEILVSTISPPPRHSLFCLAHLSGTPPSVTAERASRQTEDLSLTTADGAEPPHTSS